MQKGAITLKNVSASIGSKVILKKINVSFEKGRTYAIMGPNGSGKSTLASVIMGHPSYELGKKSEILLNGEPIHELEADQRSQKGIYLTFQSPLALSGVTIYQLMRYALAPKSDAARDKTKDPLETRNKLKEWAKKLHISEDLLSRSLNDGFSGGERKKMELLQAAMLDPDYIIFDEIDTGVDVDALRVIAEFMNEMKKMGKTLIIITHYNRILKYVEPDTVLIVKDGSILQTGGKELAEEIEKHGYTNIVETS